MTGNPVALDTNLVVDILRDENGAGRWSETLWDVCLPVQVVGEARFGALNSNRPQANLKQLDEFVARCRVLAADAITAMVYADIRFALKNAGTPIPENDIWIAAICVQHEMTLATADKHFLSVKGISLIFRG